MTIWPDPVLFHRGMLVWPNPVEQFPRTDGTFDPWVTTAWTLAGEWLTAHVAVELPATRNTAQWLDWLKAEGFIEEIENPWGPCL